MLPGGFLNRSCAGRRAWAECVIRDALRISFYRWQARCGVGQPPPVLAGTGAAHTVVHDAATAASDLAARGGTTAAGSRATGGPGIAGAAGVVRRAATVAGATGVAAAAARVVRRAATGVALCGLLTSGFLGRGCGSLASSFLLRQALGLGFGGQTLSLELRCDARGLLALEGCITWLWPSQDPVVRGRLH